jgi:shikimate kinase
MGAGKTTAARALAARLGCAWLDVDDLITGQTGLTPAQIIDQQGEARFRELETQALRVALDGKTRVIATGGGLWANEQNRELIAARQGFTVWLDAPFEICRRRIAAQGDTRPLARDEARARQLYAARRASYAQAALIINVTPEKTAEIIVDEILSSTL